MGAVGGLDHVALQMSADIVEGCRISVDVECPHTTSPVLILSYLFLEESRKVRGCSRSLNNTELE